MSGKGFYFIVPGSLATPTGGYVYDREMVTALATSHRLAGLINLPGHYPFPSAAAIRAADQALQSLPDGAAAIVDGLALAPLLPEFRTHAGRLRLTAVVHHPLCDEAGLAAERRAVLFDAERDALALVDAVITTSAATALRLGDFGIGRERIAVVRPAAIADRPLPCRRRPDRPPQILCVGSLIPRKAQDELLRALSPLRRTPWRLTLVGPPRDPAFARRIRLLARALGLAPRVAMLGPAAPSRMPHHYAAADLFILPSRYEGFGIAFAEALAHGLPVVARRTDAVAEALPAAAAWLPEQGGPRDLTALVRPLLARRAARVAAAAHARTAMRRLRSWRTARREFLSALDRISG